MEKALETGEFRQIDEVRIIVTEYEDLAVQDVVAVSRND
mgnify:CR=1 FL=1